LPTIGRSPPVKHAGVALEPHVRQPLLGAGVPGEGCEQARQCAACARPEFGNGPVHPGSPAARFGIRRCPQTMPPEVDLGLFAPGVGFVEGPWRRGSMGHRAQGQPGGSTLQGAGHRGSVCHGGSVAGTAPTTQPGFQTDRKVEKLTQEICSARDSGQDPVSRSCFRAVRALTRSLARWWQVQGSPSHPTLSLSLLFGERHEEPEA
jgi:hypothetical protein